MARGWEHSVLALIDDLEQQAEGLNLIERDLEVEDRSRAEYAHVTLASRLHALAGHPVRLTLLGGLALSGEVQRTGPDWLLLSEPAGREWVVPHLAIGVLRGATARAVADQALGVLHRLPLRALLRRFADDGVECLVHLLDGTRLEGRILRLGQDFVELRLAGAEALAPDGYDVVPLAAVAAVRPRP